MQVIGVMAQMAAAAQAAKAHRAAGDAEARALEDKRDSKKNSFISSCLLVGFWYRFRYRNSSCNSC